MSRRQTFIFLSISFAKNTKVYLKSEIGLMIGASRRSRIILLR